MWEESKDQDNSIDFWSSIYDGAKFGVLIFVGFLSIGVILKMIVGIMEPYKKSLDGFGAYL
jgi:hypothetical protein